VRTAFHDVLAGYGKKLHWTLVDEYPMKGRQGRIAIDGALLDEWKQRHGFWEAKDIHDQLDREIRKKIEQGYPTTNTIFQMPERAILYQKGVPKGLNEDIRDAKNLVELLKHFFEYREPDHEEWDSAVAEFKLRIPELAERAKQLIDAEHKSNRAFRDSFEAFYALCRQAINPHLTRDAVEKMLIQHLLTERIFRRVFHAEEFRSRNVIAAEIEKVITSMTSRQFSRDQFLSDLDRFYKAIERAAEDKDAYSEKQAFLNTVYERFFQGYSPKEADTHGIVYTPQPIGDFMVRPGGWLSWPTLKRHLETWVILFTVKPCNSRRFHIGLRRKCWTAQGLQPKRVMSWKSSRPWVCPPSIHRRSVSARARKLVK
jgi:hypothetical protein